MTLLELLVVAADGLDREAVSLLAKRLSQHSPQLTHSMEKEFVKLLAAGLGMLAFQKEVEAIQSRIDAKSVLPGALGENAGAAGSA